MVGGQTDTVFCNRTGSQLARFYRAMQIRRMIYFIFWGLMDKGDAEAPAIVRHCGFWTLDFFEYVVK